VRIATLSGYPHARPPRVVLDRADAARTAHGSSPPITCIATRAGAPFFDFAKGKLNVIGRNGILCRQTGE
jgi:hypothetical protein